MRKAVRDQVCCLRTLLFPRSESGNRQEWDFLFAQWLIHNVFGIPMHQFDAEAVPIVLQMKKDLLPIWRELNASPKGITLSHSEFVRIRKMGRKLFEIAAPESVWEYDYITGA